MNDLHKAKDRFKDFLIEIGDLKKTPIREDILQYCGSQKKSEKSIESYPKPDALLKKIEIRIEKYNSPYSECLRLSGLRGIGARKTSKYSSGSSLSIVISENMSTSRKKS